MLFQDLCFLFAQQRYCPLFNKRIWWWRWWWINHLLNKSINQSVS